MTSFIRKNLFAGSDKNASSPQILVILCFYTIIVTAYTGLFFDIKAMLVRLLISIMITVFYIVIERTKLSVAVTAFVSSAFIMSALVFGAVYFRGDFLIFTYSCGIAMISLTYLKPKSLMAYIIFSSLLMAVVLFVFRINLLGASFSAIYNTLYFIVSIALNTLVYIFCRFTVRTFDALTEAKNEANYAAQAKSAFLANMSHEIRTPLNAILGITEIQFQDESLKPEVSDALEKIYNSGSMLLGIINDILDLSKIEAGKLEIFPSDYNIASLINDTVQLNIMRIGSKPIKFELDVDENIPENMIGDELRIKQILNNILSNAFKYTKEGIVRLTVSADRTKEEDEETSTLSLIFRVSDTGQGMTGEQVKELFKEYTRFNETANRMTEGTGLGMSITNNLIRMMNGTIEVESEPGKGSLFTVYIPQTSEGGGVLGKALVDNLRQFRTDGIKDIKREQITREPMPYGSVLIVDDVETNIFVARGLLAPYKLSVDSVSSGFDAIKRVEDGNLYDIIFMDHMMPEMDGIEAAKRIRSTGYTSPIVALTANAVVGQADMFISSGFDEFISKPIDISQLNIVLNKLIRDKQTPETLAAAHLSKDEKNLTEQMQQHSGIDENFAKIFVRDAQKSLSVLERIMADGGPKSEEDKRAYTINTHGMKSALANIGETQLSAIALKLEQAGRDGLAEVISSETSGFIDSLRSLVEELTPEERISSYEENIEDKEYLSEKLLAVKAACEEYDEEKVDSVLIDLTKRTWSKPTEDLLNIISENLLHSDFDEIQSEIDLFLG